MIVMRVMKGVGAPFWSPMGLAMRAILIVVFFLILHAAGLREYTSFISGTSTTGEPLTHKDCVLGGVYLIFFFATAVMTPILIIAAGIMWGLEAKLKSMPVTSGENEKSYE